MDPASTVSIAGIVINIVELVRMIIKLRSKTYDRRKDADVYFISLRTYLGASRPGLIST